MPELLCFDPAGEISNELETGRVPVVGGAFTLHTSRYYRRVDGKWALVEGRISVRGRFVRPNRATGTVKVSGCFAGRSFAFRARPCADCSFGLPPPPPKPLPPLSAAFTIDPDPGSTTIYANDQVTFNGPGSDSSDVIRRVAWDFGDGKTSVSTSTCSSCEPENLVAYHFYEQPGTYTVHLAMKTWKGRTASASRELTIAAH